MIGVAQLVLLGEWNKGSYSLLDTQFEWRDTWNEWNFGGEISLKTPTLENKEISE
jgi:hypothetical protein